MQVNTTKRETLKEYVAMITAYGERSSTPIVVRHKVTCTDPDSRNRDAGFIHVEHNAIIVGGNIQAEAMI